jgi:hypothetical protein
MTILERNRFIGALRNARSLRQHWFTDPRATAPLDHPSLAATTKFPGGSIGVRRRAGI